MRGSSKASPVAGSAVDCSQSEEKLVLITTGLQGVSSWSRLKQTPPIKWLGSWWYIIVTILTPLLLLPLPLLWTSMASRTFYVILIIAVYWVTEVVPIAGTCLLPLVLFPALGILSADDTARNYMKDVNILIVGSLMIAIAVEKWNLHKRLALLVLLLVGSKPKWLLLGFMGTTGFLSMWISNTATVAMMLPIAQAILLQLKEDFQPSKSPADDGDVTWQEGSVSVTNGSNITTVKFTRSVIKDEENQSTTYESLDEACTENILISQTVEDDNLIEEASNDDGSTVLRDQENIDGLTEDKRFSQLAKSLMLGVAYSANIGGIGTLTGTPPNIVLGGLASDLGINFGVWFVFAMPQVILALLVAWMYLSFLYCDDCCLTVKKKLFKRKLFHVLGQKSRSVIKEEYRKLGRISYAEVIVLIVFVLLVLLWLFREPKLFQGWGALFKSEDGKSFVSDSTPAIAVVFLLFLIPSQPCCSWTNWLKSGQSPRLLDWKSVQKSLPWNVIMILGSGFAIAQAAEESGLSDWFGSKLIVFHSIPLPLLALLVSALVAMVTEFVSNTATTTLFLPILRKLAISLCVHPLYLMIPATVSASFAFMFPVATPPNAIAFSYGYLKVHNMALTGLMMNIMCILIVTLGLNVIALPLFKLHEFPLHVINSTNCITNETTIY